MGTVHQLGAGVTTDTAGQPLQEGDRVVYRYFNPCGRCRACLRRNFKSCPTRQSNWSVSCEVWPHFQGGYGEYFYLGPNHAIFRLPDEITDEMAAGHQLRLHPGLRGARHRRASRPGGPS